jgi:hypothetical protein
MKQYAKTIVAIISAALVVLSTALSDGTVTSDEWWEIAAAGLGGTPLRRRLVTREAALRVASKMCVGRG